MCYNLIPLPKSCFDPVLILDINREGLAKIIDGGLQNNVGIDFLRRGVMLDIYRLFLTLLTVRYRGKRLCSKSAIFI